MCLCDRISNFQCVLWTFQPAVFSCNTKRKLMYSKYNEILLSARYPFVWQIIIDVFWWRTNTYTQTHSQTQKTQIPMRKSIHSIRYNLWHGMAFSMYIFLVAKPFDCQFIRFSSKCLLSGFLWIANCARMLKQDKLNAATN